MPVEYGCVVLQSGYFEQAMNFPNLPLFKSMGRTALGAGRVNRFRYLLDDGHLPVLPWW